MVWQPCQMNVHTNGQKRSLGTCEGETMDYDLTFVKNPDESFIWKVINVVKYDLGLENKTRFVVNYLINGVNKSAFVDISHTYIPSMKNYQIALCLATEMCDQETLKSPGLFSEYILFSMDGVKNPGHVEVVDKPPTIEQMASHLPSMKVTVEYPCECPTVGIPFNILDAFGNKVEQRSYPKQDKVATIIMHLNDYCKWS